MNPLGIDDGLLARLRDAGRQVVWTPAGGRARSRTARLGDESARVRTGPDPTIEVSAGPVGALVLLLEIDRRGPTVALGSRNGGRSPEFPDGSIVARWDAAPLDADARPTVRDLVELARYALP